MKDPHAVLDSLLRSITDPHVLVRLVDLRRIHEIARGVGSTDDRLKAIAAIADDYLQPRQTSRPEFSSRSDLVANPHKLPNTD